MKQFVHQKYNFILNLIGDVINTPSGSSLCEITTPISTTTSGLISTTTPGLISTTTSELISTTTPGDQIKSSYSIIILVLIIVFQRKLSYNEYLLTLDDEGKACVAEEQWHDVITSELENDCTAFTSDTCTSLNNHSSSGKYLFYTRIQITVCLIHIKIKYIVDPHANSQDLFHAGDIDINLQRFLIVVISDVPSITACKY